MDNITEKTHIRVDTKNREIAPSEIACPLLSYLLMAGYNCFLESTGANRANINFHNGRIPKNSGRADYESAAYVEKHCGDCTARDEFCHSIPSHYKIPPYNAGNGSGYRVKVKASPDELLEDLRDFV